MRASVGSMAISCPPQRICRPAPRLYLIPMSAGTKNYDIAAPANRSCCWRIKSPRVQTFHVETVRYLAQALRDLRFPNARSQSYDERFSPSDLACAGRNARLEDKLPPFAHRARFFSPRFFSLSHRQWQKCPLPRLNADYCVPPPAAATPSTICVPPSNWISCLAPSRMLEACAILGSCCPGALFASSTPGTDVVAMAMLPFLATTVPAAGPPFPAGVAPGSAPCLAVHR